MSTTRIFETSPDHEIVTIRVVKARRPLVFKAWSDPEHLKRWWGPHGFTNTFHVFDFREGGKWTFTMHGPEKGNYPNDCTFLKIREPELISWERQSKPLFEVEVRFVVLSSSETQVIFKQIFQTAGECEKLRKYVPEKNEENMDRLEEELTRIMQ